MRFLYHHRTQAEDGQAVHIRALQRALVAEGHLVEEVGLVAQGGDGAERARARSRWAIVAKLPRALRELAEYAYASPARGRIVAAARDFRPDVVYERYAFGNTAGVSAARVLGVPLLLEVNSPMVAELSATRGLSFPRLARRVEDWIFSSADRVLAVSGVLRDMIVERGASPERVLVVPNGVDLERYAAPDDEDARRAARTELGLAEGDDGPVVGFVGYYRAWHRLELAVDALAERGLGNARLVLIGDGPARESIAAHAARRGVGERVHFFGAVEHERVPRLLPAFDVALLPAINPYASPLKLQEYMAAGLATVAPDQPNLREVLSAGETAELFPPDDAAAFVAAVARLARDPARARAIGLAARAHVERADLTWRGNARRVADIARAARAERAG